MDEEAEKKKGLILKKGYGTYMDRHKVFIH